MDEFVELLARTLSAAPGGLWLWRGVRGGVERWFESRADLFGWLYWIRHDVVGCRDFLLDVGGEPRDGGRMVRVRVVFRRTTTTNG